MKVAGKYKRVTILLLLFACIIKLQAQELHRTWKNPLAIEFGDPFILYDSLSGRYYMYGTGGGAVNGFAAYSSANLADWKYEGQVYSGKSAGSWGTGDFWAPEVYACNGKFYMFYSAQWKDNPKNELEN